MGWVEEKVGNVTEGVSQAVSDIGQGLGVNEKLSMNSLTGSNSVFGGVGDLAEGDWAGFRDRTLIPVGATAAALYGGAALYGAAGGTGLAGVGYGLGGAASYGAGLTGAGLMAGEVSYGAAGISEAAFIGGGAGAGMAGAGAAAASTPFWSSATPWLMGGSMLASAYGANQQSSAIRDAASQSAAASAQSLDFQRQALATQMSAAAPQMAAGRQGLEGMTRLANDPNAYQQSPYAHFLQQQGERKAIAAAQASGGMSGGALAALSQQAQGQAGAGYTDSFNRFASMAGTGQTAQSQAAAAQSGFATNAANITMQNATTQGNASMAQAGAQSGMVNNMMNTAMQGYGMSQGLAPSQYVMR